MSKLLSKLVASCLFLMFVCISISAQSSTATLSGTIEDENGAVVPGARITVTHDATGQVRHATTNESGSFTIPLLPPGEYIVLVEREGFTRVQLTGIVLNVGDQKAVQVQLKVGDIQGDVLVTSDASLVRTDGSVGTIVNQQFVSNMPLNGRSFQSLITLAPGVTVTTSSDTTPGQFSVNGQRSNANYFTVDGVSANSGVNPNLGNAGISQVLSGSLPTVNASGGTNSLVSIDALEEFKIQTSTYSAEFGRQPGGQISLLTRSGTNQFHGSIFDYLRNDVFDANDWFANSVGKGKAPLRQNQFGGTFSGPILLPKFGEGGPKWYRGHDRTFFFFSYEGLRLTLPQALVVNVPSVRLRQIATPAISQLLNAFPQPNNSSELLNANGQLTGLSPFTGVYSDPSTFDATSLRIDHTISNKLTLFGRYNDSPSESKSRSSIGLSQVIKNRLATRTFTTGATSSLTSRVTNEFRFNYSTNTGRNDNWLDTFGGAVPITDSAIIPSLAATGGVLRSLVRLTFPAGSAGISLGPSAEINQRQLNIVDNLSLIHHQHQFKFGVDFRRMTPQFGRYDYLQNIVFTNETQIRNGTVALTQISSSQGAKPIFTNFAVYGQDVWQVSRRLTLNLGLRWEFNPPPKEADGKTPIGVVGVENLPTATLAPVGAPIYKTFYNAFAPRVAIAYQLSDKSGWERVVRGGFGVYYDLGSGQGTIGFLTFPFLVSRTLANASFPIPPAQAFPPPPPVIALPISSLLFAPNPDLRLPYTLQWNVTVEQSLGGNQIVSAAYVAAIGRELLTTQQLNVTRPTGGRPNPNFGTIAYTSNGPTSDYHSLQLQYSRRLSRGLQALVNYTWAHALDEVSDEATTSVLDRGNADFDIRHNLSSAISYNLPGPRKGPGSKLLGNWWVDGIFHAQSAAPVNVVAGSFVREDGTLVNTRPDLLPGIPLYVNDVGVPGGRRFNSAAFRAPVAGRQGSLGRNALRGLPLYQLDLSIRRKFAFNEHGYVQLKADVFNILNHPNFGAIGNNFASPATFGVPSQMLGRSLGGLSALYQIGGPRSFQFSLKLGF